MPKQPPQQISLAIPHELHRALKELSGDTGVSMNQLVRAALVQYLKGTKK